MKEQELAPFSITTDYDSIKRKDVFSDLLKVLMAYARKLIGNDSLRANKNRDELAYDLSMEAIRKYLEAPEKFDPKRNPDLVLYIKYNILRRLVSNYRELKSQKNEVLFENNDPHGIEVSKAFMKELDIHDSLDLKQTVDLIADAVSEDPKLQPVFEMRYLKDFSRAETIKELSISDVEYNNRIRRLDTIRKRIIKLQQTEIGI